MVSPIPKCSDSVRKRSTHANDPDADLLAEDRLWADDIFAVAMLQIGGHRLIERSPEQIRQFIEELERVVRGCGSGGIYLEQALWNLDALDLLHKQVAALRYGVHLVGELGAVELADRLRRLQEFVLLVDVE